MGLFRADGRCHIAQQLTTIVVKEVEGELPAEQNSPHVFNKRICEKRRSYYQWLIAVVEERR